MLQDQEDDTKIAEPVSALQYHACKSERKVRATVQAHYCQEPLRQQEPGASFCK